MKTMTCMQLGGPCGHQHQGQTADEIIKAQDRHLKETVASTMVRASGSERARRSSLVTTRVSPARQAANAWRSPGRSRLVPVKPWST